MNKTLPALVSPGARVGVIYPLAAQESLVQSKYADSELDIVMTGGSPYHRDAMRIVCEAAGRLVASGATILVLDCIGYPHSMAVVVGKTTGLPAVLSRRLATHVAAELL